MRTLLWFAAPFVLTDIVQQFYSTVDLLVLGQFYGNAGIVGSEVVELLT
jgi:Na+-driven multidrug efflux pump